MERQGIRFTGIVQGVGFRPLVAIIARELDLTGWVLNDSEGVYAEIQGTPENLSQFIPLLETCKAPICRIDSAEVNTLSVVLEESEFVIAPSPEGTVPATFIGADTAPCEACIKELRDPNNRRHNYSFINCTHCGPRYTIVEQVPYDRKFTSMKAFQMCEPCAKEYSDETNRRYHAEPNACAVCGPHYRLVTADDAVVPTLEGLAVQHVTFETDDLHDESSVGNSESSSVANGAVHSSATEQNRQYEAAIFSETRRRIEAGEIIAIKGIGGYHLACDATNKEAVARLRARKNRPKKPLAVMVDSLETAETIGVLSDAAIDALTSPERPIVLVPQRAEGAVAWDEVVPQNNYIGIMLPYAPVHYVLLPKGAIWVMTSGNRSGDPVIYEEQRAFEEVGDVADAFLVHNRPIVSSVDDSVVQIIEETPHFIRRSRGYVPTSFTVNLPNKGKQSVLAMGGDLKNAFALNRGEDILMGPHIGDLANRAMNESLRHNINRFTDLFGITPAAVVGDYHPNYYSSQYGKEYASIYNIPYIEVQHHHAHIASVMAEYNVTEPVLGICFDGTGYGTDGTIWGGEFLLCQGASMKRLAHITSVPMPGGEVAAREPWRQALWYLRYLYGHDIPAVLEPWIKGLPSQWKLLDQVIIEQLKTYKKHQEAKDDSKLEGPLRESSKIVDLQTNLVKGVSMIKASSGGRLFDTVGSLLGLGYSHSFDGQVAMGLEQLAYGERGNLLEFTYTGKELDFAPAIACLIDQMEQGVSKRVLAASFHRTLAYGISEVMDHLCGIYGIKKVVLSGGVFQNHRLVRGIVLHNEAHEVLRPKEVSANDGGLALGQLWLAHQKLGGM
ncbi:carbamoyltransferase HypF [uncultured Veillonella sp.]|uniref:carbamoyltransferase HypF n=1 Tax=uncultured Veillonella sp. TaxID=159268 RepID=UPI0025DC2F2D|nr:carbamoyltransferase HypF [uncultured Veillonella sp.]